MISRFLTFIGIALLVPYTVAADGVPFQHVTVDPQGPKDPWIKLSGDVNNDGYEDIVIGGRGGPVVWYAYPDWKKTKIPDGGYNTVDGELGDIDRDGDLDVVISAEFWYENPLPDGDPQTASWKTHKIVDLRTHDIELSDLDKDGDLDIIARDQSGFGHKTGNKVHFFMQTDTDSWVHREIDCPHGEGLQVADVDLDGDDDVLTGLRWYENAGGDPLQWKEHIVTDDMHQDTAVKLGDINGDGHPDIVLTQSEGKLRLSWFEAPADPTQPNWKEHNVDPSVDYAHGIGLADFDGDGDLDIATAEMHQSDRDRVMIYWNQGKGESWKQDILATTGSHNIRLMDIDNDGDTDIMGANWSGGFQPIEIWVNQKVPSKKTSQIDKNWKDDEYPYRAIVKVDPAGIERRKKPVEVSLDLRAFVKSDSGSIQGRMVEPRSGIDPFFQIENRGNGRFELIFFMDERTKPDQIRSFHFYFHEGNQEKTDKFRVHATENVMHEGQPSFQIRNSYGIMYYHQFGAGFASMEDASGNDWLGYRTGGGPAGEYRGIPNMGYPEGYSHPGKEVSNSKLLDNGPVRVRIESTSNDGKMKCLWDVFPTYARMTLTTMRPPYWFLYEGTPGGKLEEGKDTCTRPGGLTTLCSEKWDGDIDAHGEPGEWVYFSDEDHHLYLIHHEDDEATDSYWPMQQEMTVFGFGRQGLNKFMTDTPQHFTIGFEYTNSPDYVVQTIRSAYIPMRIETLIETQN